MNGVFIPESDTPLPDVAVLVIVTLALPEFLSWTVCEFVCPTVTLPKLTVEGVAASDHPVLDPELDDDPPPDEELLLVPTPLTEYVPLASRPANAIELETDPDDVGENVRVIDAR